MSEDKITTTASIVSAYVSNNSVRAEDLVGLITTVHGKLVEIEGAETKPVAEKPVPFMPWKKTIGREALISLEDGKKYKTLRRHLAKLGLTPDAYRSRWNLPIDYPMVAPEYSERRSALAKTAGLGQRAKVEDAAPIEPEPVTIATVKSPKKVTPHLKPKDRAKNKKGDESGDEAA